LADVIGFITPEQVIEAVSGVVTIHRDYGDRTNRKHARLKYILHDWGAERFTEVLRERLSFELLPARLMPAFELHDHLGWHEQGDGKLYLGLPIENGRIADWENVRLRTGLREIIRQYELPVRLTAQQNLILVDIVPEQRADIESLLAIHHIRMVEQFSGARRYGMACPALPTCGLAITEAERALPGLLDELEMVLAELGLLDDPISIRMTGCPNGCARPYVAEIALVGRSLEKYKLYLGGNLVGTRLAEPFLDLVPFSALIPTLRPLLTHYRDTRREGEAFGDFCQRVGFDHLHTVYSAVHETAAD
ncbi:MAG: NADPH-dependent assimilatory sulfite reductase hemoprotein subunit, partial [Anaerolineae bacterium]|nr:NADPH-dependent assimilatory sulfite reductase hemoprotein subunit [Anaerolineae bacterium]